MAYNGTIAGISVEEYVVFWAPLLVLVVSFVMLALRGRFGWFMLSFAASMWLWIRGALSTDYFLFAVLFASLVWVFRKAFGG